MKTNDKEESLPRRTALVLAGGGARGAYQAGVLSGLVELGVLEPGRSGLDVFCGSSAGAINSVMLAAHADRLSDGVAALEKLWGSVQADDVFRTDARSIGSTGFKWAWDLTLGGAIGGVTPKSLLDTGPLRKFLDTHVPFSRLSEQIENGNLRALAVSATDLTTGDGTLFLDAQPGIEGWERRRWRIQKTRIAAEHILASSAIPIFFPSVEIAGRYYGDGAVRNTSPLSPAINLGAERIVAISVREPNSAATSSPPSGPPSIAQIAGVLLDAVMLDAIEVDMDHSQRVNQSAMLCPKETTGAPFRKVDVLWIQPSADFTALAREFSHQIPGTVRYLMRGLGSEEAINELTSYLLFDQAFCGRLIETGRADVFAARKEVEAFFAE